MIQSLKMTGQLIDITVAGTVDKDDWEKVAAAVNDALAEHESVSVYADLTHLDSMTGGAMYEDAKVSIQNLGNLDQFHKIAVVTDKNWMQQTLQVSQKLAPGVDVEVFAGEDSAEAHRWVSS